MSHSRITDYFRKQSTSVEKDNLVVDENVSGTIQTKPVADFYNVCRLKSAQDENCTDVLCVDEKQQLKTKIEQAKKMIDQIVMAQQFATDIIKEKDEKILRLQTKIRSQNKQPSSAQGISMQVNITQEATNKQPSSTQIISTQAAVNRIDIEPLNEFEKFSTHFNGEQLAMLRGVDKTLSGDSTFILVLMRLLYQNNIDDLQNVTVAGRKNSTKKKIDEVVMKVITEIFDERIDRVETNGNAKEERKKRLNKLLNSAITNINTQNNKNKRKVNLESQPMLIEKEKPQ